MIMHMILIRILKEQRRATNVDGYCKPGPNHHSLTVQYKPSKHNYIVIVINWDPQNGDLSINIAILASMLIDF